MHSCGFFPYSLHSKICLSLGTSLRQSSVMLEIKAGPGKKTTKKRMRYSNMKSPFFFEREYSGLKLTFTKCITLKLSQNVSL